MAADPVAPAAPRLLFGGAPLDFVLGDSVAIAVLRSGREPGNGGALCLSGDCGNCLGVVDGIAFVRTCQTPARPGLVAERHPAGGAPSMMTAKTIVDIPVRRERHDVVLVGLGVAGQAERARLLEVGRRPRLLDASQGEEVVSVYDDGFLVVRTDHAMIHIEAKEIVLATGRAELVPVCVGSNLPGVRTSGAARRMVAAGIDLGRAVIVGNAGAANGLPATPLGGTLVRIEGTLRVEAVVVRDGNGNDTRVDCNTLIADLGPAPRDVLARMAVDGACRVIGSAAEPCALPVCPTSGVVCPCSGTTVEDLDGVWNRGFREVELMKRSSLAGTGTCQGAACLPHLLAYVAARSGEPAQPFTARPAARQLTMGEAAAGVYFDAWRTTVLDTEHRRLGANMDRFGGWWRPWNYGDHVAEYWAVREAVSIGDVSTLGKMIVSGPDSVEFLERIYPTNVADIKVGRSRYVLLLNERGHVFDDGMIVRESDTRFVLTFTSGGAGNAEMWMRDWAETWELDVRIMDQTMSLAAINVTGPRAAELLSRLGLDDPPKFLQHRHVIVAGVECHAMRLSFTGEASWELHVRPDHAVTLWRALLDEGRDLGIRPHGLQALFGLRLEKGHVIVGMDTEMDTTPRRIDHDWAVKMDKPFFLGKEALARTASLPDQRRMVALTMESPAPVEGSPIWLDHQLVGHVATSFTSPLLGHAVMLGWLKRGWDSAGPLPTTVWVDGRAAALAQTPFYDKDGGRARR